MTIPPSSLPNQALVWPQTSSVPLEADSSEGDIYSPDQFLPALKTLPRLRNQLLEVLYACKDMDFTEATQEMAAYLVACTPAEIQVHLLHCGIIPETLPPSGSAEKLFAKASDIIVARALYHMGFQSEVITARAGEADVVAAAVGYGLVADAKAFRLSRTARNQKDFKINALSTWRGEHRFAFLVAPADMFPNTQSQIYQQAAKAHVGLLSFAHLLALTSIAKEQGVEELGQFWRGLRTTQTPTNATEYWRRLDGLFASVPSGAATLRCAKQADQEARLIVCQRELVFLELEDERINTLDRDQLRVALRASLGYHQKILALSKLPKANLPNIEGATSPDEPASSFALPSPSLDRTL